MGAIELQRRPLYSIGTVARLTGVKPDTLRVWERRYQLGASLKTPSGRRLFTQADLEHLQLVAALVASGTRIGDIASSDRRTLEVLLRYRGRGAQTDIPARKPRILFLGDAFCSWLEEHQGCLANVDAVLVPRPPSQLDVSLVDAVGGIDGVVVECGRLTASTSAMLGGLAAALDTSNILVLHRSSNTRLVDELSQQGYTTASFPPDPAFLACHLSLSVAVKEASLGVETLGRLVQGKSRLFNEQELSEARSMRSALDCECPRHISDLVRALGVFEDYSASCSVENWQEASVHACIYAYAMQARWLMEKSLMLVLEAHKEVPGV